MKTVIDLILASKEDLNIFNKGFTNLVNKKAGSFVRRNAIIIFFVLLVAFMFGLYAYLFAEPMSHTHQTYIMMIMMSAGAVIITLFNSMYKSKGVLFDSKDNDLLFSMPITKSQILASKVAKLVIYQYIWASLILVPSILVYIYFEGCSIDFFISTIALLVFLPFIATAVGALLGYIMTGISSRFKSKNTVYLILTMLLMIVIVYFSSNLGTFLENLGANSEDIEESITTLYYPLKLYRDCVLELDMIKIILFILINIVPLFILVGILSLGYYKIVSKLSENHAKSNFVLKKGQKLKGMTYSLISKELKRYFKSVIYVTNTIFGPVMLVGMAVYVYFKGFDFTTLGISEEQIIYLKDVVLYFYVTVCTFMLSTSNMAASLISIEGNTLWIIKSLPISSTRVFISKVATNCIVMLPLTYFATILVGIKFGASIWYILGLIIIATIIMVFISSAGILINLLFPKFSADEVVAVKQSKSVLIAMFGGLAISGLFMYFGTKVQETMTLNTYSLIFVGIMAIAIVCIWHYLLTEGKEKYLKLGE